MITSVPFHAQPLVGSRLGPLTYLGMPRENLEEKPTLEGEESHVRYRHDGGRAGHISKQCYLAEELARSLPTHHPAPD